MAIKFNPQWFSNNIISRPKGEFSDIKVSGFSIEKDGNKINVFIDRICNYSKWNSGDLSLEVWKSQSAYDKYRSLNEVGAQSLGAWTLNELKPLGEINEWAGCLDDELNLPFVFFTINEKSNSEDTYYIINSLSFAKNEIGNGTEYDFDNDN